MRVIKQVVPITIIVTICTSHSAASYSPQYISKRKTRQLTWLLCNLSFQSHGGTVWGQCQVCFVPNTCSPIFFLFNRECNPTLFPSLTFFIISSSVRVSGHYIQHTRYNWKMVKITTCSTMPLGHCAKTVKIATMATSAPLSWYQIEMKALKPRRPFIVKACQKGSLSSWPSSGVIRVVFITF